MDTETEDFGMCFWPVSMRFVALADASFMGSFCLREVGEVFGSRFNETLEFRCFISGRRGGRAGAEFDGITLEPSIFSPLVYSTIE